MSIEIPDPVRTAAERLARATAAMAIILFGSRARCDADEESDWDLCLLLPDDVAPGRFTPLTLWPLVSDLGIPIQIVPVRVSVFEQQRGDVNSLIHDIARDGMVILSKTGDPIKRIQALADAYPDAQAELAGGLVLFTCKDPLGYDTTDFMTYARQVAADALAGKNEDAVEEELARIKRRFLGRRGEDETNRQHCL